MQTLGEYNVAVYGVIEEPATGAMAARGHSRGGYGEAQGSGAGQGTGHTPGAAATLGKHPASFGEEEIDRIESALAELAGAAGLGSAPVLSGGKEIGLRVIVEGEGAMEALGGVERLFRRAARTAYGAGIRIVEAQVLEQARFEEWEGAEASWRQRVWEELVGIREAAAEIGRSEQRVRELDKERSAGLRTDFPEPVLRLAAGPLWVREDLRCFASAGARQRGGTGLVELPRLRSVRKERGFGRQVDLAIASEVAVPTISHAERGGRTRLDTAEKIAAAIDVSVEELKG